MQNQTRIFRAPLFLAAAAIVGLSSLVAPAQAGSTSPAPSSVTIVRAPKLKDVPGTSLVLVNRFLTLLAENNVSGLRSFLSPAFQLQRADGSYDTKANYLKNLPHISKFKVSGLVATQAGAALVVRYDADITGIINGKEYVPGSAPRLSTFTWNGKIWQMTSHANFNPLEAPVTPGSVPLLSKVSTTVLGQPIVYPTSGDAQVSTTVLTMLEGASTGWHRHDAPMVAYIMSGSVTVTYEGGIVKTYTAGEAITEAVGTAHNGVSSGPGPVVILVVNMGADGVANTTML
jgi:quercetin dioxygenase-like cupin family protein